MLCSNGVQAESYTEYALLLLGGVSSFIILDSISSLVMLGKIFVQNLTTYKCIDKNQPEDTR